MAPSEKIPPKAPPLTRKSMEPVPSATTFTGDPPSNVPCESKVSVDIAQLCDKLDEASVQEEAHIIKITNRIPISVSQFKEMFYSKSKK